MDRQWTFSKEVQKRSEVRTSDRKSEHEVNRCIGAQDLSGPPASPAAAAEKVFLVLACCAR